MSRTIYLALDTFVRDNLSKNLKFKNSSVAGANRRSFGAVLAEGKELPSVVERNVVKEETALRQY